MSTTTFVNAKAVKWYTIDCKAVFLGKTRIWPPAAASHQLGNDPYTATNEEVTLFVGDSIHLQAGHGVDWLDAQPAILRLEGGAQKGDFTPGPKGWSLQSATLPDGSNGKAYISNSHSADLDTTGMTPGTYQILAPVFFDFTNCQVLLTIHLLPALVPPPHVPVYINFRPVHYQAVEQRLLDYVNEHDADFSGAAVQHFDAKGRDILSIPGFPTAGSPYDVQGFGVVNSSGALVGTPDPVDAPNADGTFQTRYGGNWTLPATPGTYRLMAGPDASNLQVVLATIVIS